MDAKARLEEVVRLAYRDFAAGSNPRRGLAETVADALLAEFDLTPKPPQPAGPVKPAEAVTSEEAARWVLCESGVEWDEQDGHIIAMRVALDAAMPRLARDHSYVKAGCASPANVVSLAEVERRARTYLRALDWPTFSIDALVAALTASAETSAASTRTDGGGR